MIRIILIFAVLLTNAAALAQMSTHSKTPSARVMTAEEMANLVNPVNTADPEAGLPLYKRTMMPPAFGPLTVLQPAPTEPITPVVMYGGMGGLIAAHQYSFERLQRKNAAVEMRGGCWSACTLITAYIPKDRLCFEKGSFLRFHAARTADFHPVIHVQLTREMYKSYPVEIRHWIDDRGGPDSLTIESYLTMYDRELWAIGYPRCK